MFKENNREPKLKGYTVKQVGFYLFLVIAVVSRFVFDLILDTHLSHQVDAFVALSWTSVAKQLSSCYFHGISRVFSSCICSITDLQW